MFEPVYSSDGGAPKGFRCKVLNADGRYCSKLCKSYHGMLRHGWLVHNLKLQMELFDREEKQRQANELLSVRATGRTEAGGRKDRRTRALFAGEG